jgi:hypothetical protein
MGSLNPYTGWRTNCYAISLAMLLAHKGEYKPVPYIDCLTTLPFGPFSYRRKTGFAVIGVNPERGLEHALNLLGYEYTLKHGDSEKEAVEKLKNNLKRDWVLIGPVDMGYLTYDPFCRKKRGADHYIVAVDWDDEFVWVNDPEGYIMVPIPWHDFLKAWKASRISYKRGSYTERVLGRKVRNLTEREIFNTLLKSVSDTITQGKSLSPDYEVLTGSEAIKLFADDLEKRGISMLELTFIFPVCNQRCYDSAIFLTNESFSNKILLKASEIRMREAHMFGKCRLLAAKKNMNALHDTLYKIAVLDSQYTEMLIEGVRELK